MMTLIYTTDPRWLMAGAFLVGWFLGVIGVVQAHRQFSAHAGASHSPAR